MPIDEDIHAAVAAGILQREQGERLIEFLAAKRMTVEGPVLPAVPVSHELAVDPQEERLPFLRSFQDIFLTIGIILLLIGTSVAGSMLIAEGAGYLAGIVVALALAIGLRRTYRLRLPNMALAAGFTLLAGLAAGRFVLWAHIADNSRVFLAGGIGALLASMGFFGLFRLPFALGLAAAATGVIAVTLVTALAPGVPSGLAVALLSCGLAVFILAMSFDLRDSGRRNSYSDNAFWLHLAAAPMIVHASMLLLVRTGRSQLEVGDAVIVLILFLGFAIVALAIDRRAFLVSGLTYLGYAIAALMQRSQLSPSDGVTLAIILVIIGGLVVGLALGWKTLRRFLLGRLPRRGLLLYLPPIGKLTA